MNKVLKKYTINNRSICDVIAVNPGTHLIPLNSKGTAFTTNDNDPNGILVSYQKEMDQIIDIDNEDAFIYLDRMGNADILNKFRNIEMTPIILNEFMKDNSHHFYSVNSSNLRKIAPPSFKDKIIINDSFDGPYCLPKNSPLVNLIQTIDSTTIPVLGKVTSYGNLLLDKKPLMVSYNDGSVHYHSVDELTFFYMIEQEE